ncbi:MAG: type II toxin-antitoxin system Phd/YefM family antitoxin [Synechococcus sp.]
MQVAVREFKNRLSELLRRAEAGEEIVVTSHGRPVARLGPAAPCAPADPVASLRRLRSQPWLRPSDGRPILAATQPIPSVPAGEPLLSDLMLADRE